MVRQIVIFGVHHKYQTETPINPFFRQHLCDLVNEHQVDFILEEGTGLPPKSCVEVLADTLAIHWKNVDLSRDQRELVGDGAESSIHDTFQDLNLHECREWVWAVRTSATVIDSGLIVCGICHVLSLADKLRWIGFAVEGHVYTPRRDDDSLF
ncbi:MAG TPA: hypothetical protein VEJ46_01015 [Candidatus Acidoferrum sp.]|nr:hypothetical protein [Candidatus Acidoferrum sp.]